MTDSEGLSDVSRADEAAPPKVEWTTLFDGRSMAEWRAGVFGDSDELDFTDTGAILPIGVPMSGMTYLGQPPTGSYQLRVEATRVHGNDFFLGVTFPVRDGHLTAVFGGWGGTLCGLSCIDGQDASTNDTRVHMEFPNGKRQTVLIDVRDVRVKVFVNGELLIDADLDGREISTRPEVQPSLPLGLASYATRTEVHGVQLALRGE